MVAGVAGAQIDAGEHPLSDVPLVRRRDVGLPLRHEARRGRRQQRQVDIGQLVVAELRVEVGRTALHQQAIDRRLPDHVQVQAAALQFRNRAHDITGPEEAVELEVAEGLLEQRGVDQQVAAGQGRLQAQLVAVDEFAREGRIVHRGDARAARRQPVGGLDAVEVEAAGLVPAGSGHVGHQRVAPAVGRAQRARPFVLVARLPGIAAVVQHVAPRQAHVPDHGGHQSRDVGAGDAAPGERRADLRRVDQAAGAAEAAVRVGQHRVQGLALLRVASADGDVERVRRVPHVVGEQRGAACALLEVVVAAAADEGRAEGPARRLRQEQERVAGVHQARGEGAGDVAEQRDRQVGLVGAAHGDAVVAHQVLVGIEGADHPVELFGGSGQAQLLAEGVEADIVQTVAVGPHPDRRGGEVEVAGVEVGPVAHRGDRGQGGAAQPRRVPVDLRRPALVLHRLAGDVVAVGQATVGVRAGNDRRATDQGVDDGRGRAAGGGDGRAALLVAAGEVGDHADAQAVGRLEQQLSAQAVEVEVAVLAAGARAGPGLHVQETVAPALDAVEAERRGFAERVVVAGRNAEQPVVAGGDLGFRALVVGRRPRHDVDQAGRGVLAEHRALRALEHLHPLDRAEVAEAHAVARTVDAIDHHAHRRFQAGVVAHRAHAAQAHRGLAFRGGAGDAHARDQLLHLLDVAHAGVLQQLLRQHGDADRHVLQGLLPLLRGDDQRIERGRAVACRRLRDGRLSFLGLACRVRDAAGPGQRERHRAGQHVAMHRFAVHGSPLPSP